MTMGVNVYWFTLSHVYCLKQEVHVIVMTVNKEL